jgi:hypothetical protein
MVGMIAAAQPTAKILSAPKLAVKEASPANMTTHQPRRWERKKMAMNMYTAIGVSRTVIPTCFFKVNY